MTVDRRSSRRADPPAPTPDEQRAADHAAIDRLADDLVPALIAKLSATGLGEIEIGEDDWTVRVRRPGDGAAARNRRATDRGSRAQPGHAGHSHGPAGFEGHRSSRDGRAPGGVPSGSGSNGSAPGVVGGPTDGAASPTPDRVGVHRAVATSPAVGIYQPRIEARAGTRVRAGDRIGSVDMLGIPQDVVAPADGIVGASLAEAGEAVEYGQELVVIELTSRATERSEA